jgi:hypothetical protein
MLDSNVFFLSVLIDLRQPWRFKLSFVQVPVGPYLREKDRVVIVGQFLKLYTVD